MKQLLLYPLPCHPLPNDGLIGANPLCITGGETDLSDLAGACVVANCLWPRKVLNPPIMPEFAVGALLLTIASAPCLAPEDPNRSVLIAASVKVPGLMALTSAILMPCLMSAKVLNIRPFSVRSAVSDRIVPVLVLTTGSTRTTVLVTGLMIRLVTIPVHVTSLVFVTITVVVKLWQMKKPGNEKPNQTTG